MLNSMFLKHRLSHWLLFFLVNCSLISLFADLPPVVAADECTEKYQCDADNEDEDEYFECVEDKKVCLEDKIAEVKTQKITLQNSIDLINGQINLQEVKITQLNLEIGRLERDITELTERITGLNFSLDRLTTLLVERIRSQHKTKLVNPLVLMVEAESLDEFATNYKYITLASKQTALAMQRAEQQRVTYDEQKALKEDKQNEVVAKQQILQTEQNQLAGQRRDQQFLLTETKSNEAQYQAELARTLAELEAIQSIIAGKGAESKSKEVEAGEKIASIIVGASPCSTGTHLHFETVVNGVNRNPATYLKDISAQWNNSPDGPFTFGGDWDWPVKDAAKINQGYGMTYYARVRRAYGGAPHTGIDMASKSTDYTVRAVQDGTLYRGSIRCGGGLLKYVKVEHDKGDMDTYYLHVNY